MQLIKARGRLTAIGGGEDKEKSCLILKEFVRLAGDEKARIVVFTTAADSPVEAAAKCNSLESICKKPVSDTNFESHQKGYISAR